jgi:hypothetical protein
MMKCEEAGAMMEKEEFEKLPFMKRFGLKFHLMMCKCCTGYKHDVSHLNSIIKTANSENADSSLSDEEKAEIKSSLTQE